MARIYPLHFYNPEGWLKIPAPLWLAFAIGLQHLWFFAPTLHKVLPEMGELQLDLWLIAGDLLVVSVLLSIGHRVSTGGLGFMREIWRNGWLLLVLAYVATVIGFLYRQWEVVNWVGHRLHNWSLFVLAMNLLPLAYLLFSRHARDVFSYSPPQPEKASSAKELGPSVNDSSATPSAKEPPGVLMRKRQAEKLFVNYPLSGDSPEGELRARELLANDLENAQLWHDLGVFYLQHNRLNQAVDFVRHASLIDGANALYLRNLGELCRRCGRLQEAVEAGLAAAKLNPTDPEAHYNLGVIHTSAKKLALAEKNYLRALELKPDHQAARQNLAAIRAKSAA